MKRGLLLVVLVILGAVALSRTIAIAADSVPLPSDVKIVPPDLNLPQEIRDFSGKWGGRWWALSQPRSNGVDAVLIIEEIINERQATVIYCWGDSLEWNMDRTCLARQKADFSRNSEGKAVLSFTGSRSITKITFRLKGGKLEGTHAWGYITMKKIQ